MTEEEMFGWAMLAWVAMMIVTMLAACLQMMSVAPCRENDDEEASPRGVGESSGAVSRNVDRGAV